MLLAALHIRTNSLVCILRTLKESNEEWEFYRCNKERKAFEHDLFSCQTNLIEKKLTSQYTDAVKLFSIIHLTMYIIGLAVIHSGIN